VAKNLGVRASYVGNHTAHLWYNGRQLNNPQTQAPGNIQPRRPYQPWGTIAWITSGGDSTIHQLQLEAIQRLARGVTFQLEYSWNRSLDNTPDQRRAGESLRQRTRPWKLGASAATHLHGGVYL
jgi:hypothetical protein